MYALIQKSGLSFAGDHDRKTHEKLHSGEKPWVCGGTLPNGEHWGCGWRYARKANLQRHFRSDSGRHCIKPLHDKKTLKGDATTGLMDAARRQVTSDIPAFTQPQAQQMNAEHSAAPILTAIARTSDNGAFSATARPNISQAATSTSLYDFSTKLDWHEWDEILQGLENGSDTQVTSSWNVHDLRKRVQLLENTLGDKGFDVAVVSNDPSRMPEARATIPVPPAASVSIHVSQADTILIAEQATIKHSKAQDEKSSFYGMPQDRFRADQRMDPALTLSFDDPARNENEVGLSIPVEHTTAAHKLLMWPSIKRLLSCEYDEDYVMRLEEERSLISIYGQDEISCTADDTQLPTNTRTRNGRGLEEMKSNLNGTSKVQSAASSSDTDAEIDRFGLLNLDSKTARQYYQSYLDRMHRLHPFLDQSELEVMVDAFIRCYCPPTASLTIEPNTLCQAKKCKRSYEDLHSIRGGSADPSSASSRPRVGRNIDNAIIILVFALGAICECKSPLPDPIIEEKANFEQQGIPRPLDPLRTTLSNSKHAANVVVSPANSDSVLPTTSSFYDTVRIANQSIPPSTSQFNPKTTPSQWAISSTRDEFGQLKNQQVIPGLALYGFATTILGNLQGGVELKHVQAGLLAGLYAGQLAHPFQSHAWICQAARACQVLVRQKSYERLEEGAQQDLHKFAYWTCLQLESDLLAELDIPASGISQSKGRIGLPKGRYTISLPNDFTAPSTRMMMFYSAQIHLYNIEKHGQTYWSSSMRETHSLNLELWRSSLPSIMQWKDSEPPTNDINAALMRAKYYAARYIIHRPILYHALHYGQIGVRLGSVGQTSVDSLIGSAPASQTQQISPSVTQTSPCGTVHMQGTLSDIGSAPSNPSSSFPHTWTPPTVNLRKLPCKLRHACRVCVESVILSTEVFDGIEDRLVVPNIFGTAHAQFGNMLVLSATYTSSLSELVPRSTLERLLRRTIGFLCDKNISPTLRADARILSEIYEKIFGSAVVLGKDA
ncbi:unnamed protein product [Penicillium discolor]